MKVLMAAFVGALMVGVSSASGSVGKGHCRFLLLTVPGRGAMPRLLASEPNYGQALKAQRLFADNGIPSRIGSVCSGKGAATVTVYERMPPRGWIVP